MKHILIYYRLYRLRCSTRRLCASRTPSSFYFFTSHHTRVVLHPDYWDAANEGLDLTFDKDRRRGTDLEGEGKRLDRPNIG